MSCVLITGATGVIGSELVPLFLDSDDCRLRLIVRADSASHLQERTGELLAYWGRRPQDPAVAGRVEVLAGDVGRPRLGLDDATYRRLTGEVTHVVHSAGNVKLSQSLEEARANAVGSAQRVVEFARSCQDRGLLQKLDVVSTVGVAGRMPGLVPERRLSEPREFHNTYEQAKAEAEELLFQELQTGLPVTIHRPSMVVGNSQTGRSSTTCANSSPAARRGASSSIPGRRGWISSRWTTSPGRSTSLVGRPTAWAGYFTYAPGRKMRCGLPISQSASMNSPSSEGKRPSACDGSP
jgi:thioester reductase-like protein